MASLQGKVITITGAASGIGKALSHLAAARGAKLALADVQQDLLDTTVAEIKAQGIPVIGTQVDVSDPTAVNNWIKTVVAHYGRLDGAANVAGMESKTGVLGDLADEEWDKVIAINLTGVMYCTRAQLQVMDEGGSIVNAASLAGVTARAYMPAYTAAKHGVVGLTRAVAKEYGPKGIRANAVCPGFVDTPMLARVSKDSGTTKSAFKPPPLQRHGTPEELAQLFVYLLSDDSSYISGSVQVIDGGLMA